MKDDKAVGVDKSGASLLAAFKSHRAQSQPPPQPAAASTPPDYDNDSVVEFDYEDEPFEDDDASAADPQPEPIAPAPSQYDPPTAAERPGRRMRSIFDTISQLRSRSNSSAKLLATTALTTTTTGDPIPNDDAGPSDDGSPRFSAASSQDGTTCAAVSSDGLSAAIIEGRSQESFTLAHDPTPPPYLPVQNDLGLAALAPNGRPAAAPDPVLSIRTGADVVVDQRASWAPNSSQESPAAADWAISESTPRLGPIPVPDRGRDVPAHAPAPDAVPFFSRREDDLPAAQQAGTVAAPSPFFATRYDDGDGGGIVSDRTESVSPTRSVATLCDSNAETRAAAKPAAAGDTVRRGEHGGVL